MPSVMLVTTTLPSMSPTSLRAQTKTDADQRNQHSFNHSYQCRYTGKGFFFSFWEIGVALLQKKCRLLSRGSAISHDRIPLVSNLNPVVFEDNRV